MCLASCLVPWLACCPLPKSFLGAGRGQAGHSSQPAFLVLGELLLSSSPLRSWGGGQKRALAAPQEWSGQVTGISCTEGCQRLRVLLVHFPARPPHTPAVSMAASPDELPHPRVPATEWLGGGWVPKQGFGGDWLPFPPSGLVAVFKYHKNNHYPDAYSLHSWCGILAFGGYFVQVRHRNGSTMVVA